MEHRPKVRYKIILKNFLSGGFYEIVFLRLETFLFAKSSLFGPLGELPQRPELFGPLGGSAPGQSAVRSPTSAATTVTIELRPSATELPSATVVYPRQVKILPPWEQLLKAHYRSTFHRPGIGYNHFRRGIPSGREWLCVGKNRPPKSYNQGPKTLKQILSSSTQKWISGADWKDNVVAFSQRQWDTLGV